MNVKRRGISLNQFSLWFARNLLHIFVLTSLSPLFLVSQVNLDFNGYVYDMPAFEKVPQSASFFGFDTGEVFFAMNLTRCRLRPILNFDENTKISLQYEADLLLTKLALPFFTGTGKTNRQAVNLSWQIINKYYVNARHYIDILYFRKQYTSFEFTLGRQLISWGVGRIWQPSDLFNPINPANFSKFEKDGADAASAKFFLGDFTDLEMVYNFREKFSESNAGGRFRTNFSEYDVSVMSGWFDNNFVIGGDFAGNLLNAGIRGEGIYSFNRNKTFNYLRFIFGIDYQFTSDLYALAEYQFNGAGTSDKDKYDFARLTRGEIQNVNRNYLCLSGNYQVHPLVGISLAIMNNLNDLSGYISLSSKYNASENFNLGIGGMIFHGQPRSEYWYYPPAVYLLGEYYF